MRVLENFIITTMLITLTGCPEYGDILHSDEEAVVSMEGENTCFWVGNSEKYKPLIITVTRRGAKLGNEKFTLLPPLVLLNHKWCIKPEFYKFPESGQFIVTYTLRLDGSDDRPRHIVSGVEVSNGYIYNIRLTDMEIIRPYSQVY